MTRIRTGVVKSKCCVKAQRKTNKTMQNFEISSKNNYIETIKAVDIVEAVKWFCLESNILLDEICFDYNIKSKDFSKCKEVEFLLITNERMFCKEC